MKAAVLALNAGAVREDLKAEDPRRRAEAIVRVIVCLQDGMGEEEDVDGRRWEEQRLILG